MAQPSSNSWQDEKVIKLARLKVCRLKNMPRTIKERALKT